MKACTTTTELIIPGRGEAHPMPCGVTGWGRWWRGGVVLYSRGVGVRAWRDGARVCRLQHLRRAHHHVKLTWV